MSAFTTAQALINMATPNGRDPNAVFEEYLDFLIGIFNLDLLVCCDFDLPTVLVNYKSHKMLPLAEDWFKTMDDVFGKGGWLDYFGSVYEQMFQTKSKQSHLQQYFTPEAVSDLCAKIVAEESSGIRYFSEPSCGSGRNLLALWAKTPHSNKHYYIGEDLDSVSVKMCALNLLIHGACGRVICHNTLFPDSFIFGFEINEVRHPFQCDLFSIRPISKSEYLKLIPFSKDGRVDK